MKKMYYVGVIGSLLLSTLCFADMLSNKAPPVAHPKEDALEFIHANQSEWTFSGYVYNENNEPYHYFFKMQRKHQRLYAQALLSNDKTQQIRVFKGKSAAMLDLDAEATAEMNIKKWEAGQLFLQFNKINNSWILSAKSPENTVGFNFKIDMLGQADVTTEKKITQENGIHLFIGKTGRLNGHIQMNADAKEEFVTAHDAWFQQAWLSEPAKNPLAVTTLFCSFTDHDGFYAVNMKEDNAVFNALSGWRTGQGQSMPISQFIRIYQSDPHAWQIQSISPKLALILKDELQTQHLSSLVFGHVSGYKALGVCSLNDAKFMVSSILPALPEVFSKTA